MSRDQPFSFRTSDEALKAYRKAADQAGLSVSEWVRLVCDTAAGGSTIDEQLARWRELERAHKEGRRVRDGKW